MNYYDSVRQIAATRKSTVTAIETEKERHLLLCGDYYQTEMQLRALTLDGVMGKTIDISQLNNLKAQKEKYEKANGLTIPPPKCTACEDSGLKNGSPCDCAKRLSINSSLKGAVEIPLKEKSDIDLKIFDGEQKKRIEKAYKDCEKIITDYPTIKIKIVALLGSTGTGKTYLAAYMANLALSRNLSVVAASAFSINQRVWKYHTTFDDSKEGYLLPLIDTDVLVIDDLGTESILKNVTLEYIYQIINERNLRGKLTVLTSNLKPEAILSRYGERIYSRIFDKSLCYASIFTGADKRKIF